MRLSPAQITAIRQGAAQLAGHAARVWLFGSRVRDDARGGDVDVLIKAPKLMHLPIHSIALAEGMRL
jgi:predicted nucleotidyltransferase